VQLETPLRLTLMTLSVPLSFLIRGHTDVQKIQRKCFIYRISKYLNTMFNHYKHKPTKI